MPRDVSLPKELGRHGRHSRVIWHPGSIPPYSSLWITIQRFLMLNQPTRSTFAHDFLEKSANGRKVPLHTSPRHSINDYQSTGDQSPVRRTRFARVLKESAESLSFAHVGDFPSMARPYFGDFAVCPCCLAEGFHSALFSFRGMQVCPAHGARLESLQACSTISRELFINALRNTLGPCQFLQKILSFPEARVPKRHPLRDLALGDIAQWLMDIGSRCWLGQHGAKPTAPIDEFNQRLVHLRTVLQFAHASPPWTNADQAPLPAPSNVEVVALGGVKLCGNDLVTLDDRRARGHQTNLGLSRQTLFGDFKAMRRHIKRHILGRQGCYWLARLGGATSQTEVDTILNRGGSTARDAWLFLAWSGRLSSRDFNPKEGLHTRPIQFDVSYNIPLWIGGIQNTDPSKHKTDVVRLWITRHLSAAGLLAFWRSLCDDAANSPQFEDVVNAHLLVRKEPKWSLGISVHNELKLCLHHAPEHAHRSPSAPQRR